MAERYGPGFGQLPSQVIPGSGANGGPTQMTPFVVRETIPQSGNLPPEIVAGFRDSAPVLNGFAGAIEKLGTTATWMFVSYGAGAAATAIAGRVGGEVIHYGIDLAIDIATSIPAATNPYYDNPRIPPTPPAATSTYEAPSSRPAPTAPPRPPRFPRR